MKTLRTLLTALCIFLVIGSYAETNKDIESSYNVELPRHLRGRDMCKGGLYLNTMLFFPSGKYLAPVDSASINSDDRYKIGYGLEIGNYFRFVDLDYQSIALKTTWLSFGYSMYENSNSLTFRSFTGSFIKPGFAYSLAVADDNAVDVYYQIAPSFIYEYTDNYNLLAFGVTHAFGFSYRYKIFSLGVEYDFGNINGELTTEGTTANNFSKEKYHTGNLRLNFGLRF